jgi:hypothetical protein
MEQNSRPHKGMSCVIESGPSTPPLPGDLLLMPWNCSYDLPKKERFAPLALETITEDSAHWATAGGSHR